MPHTRHTRGQTPDAYGTDLRYSSRSNSVPDILQIHRHAGVGVLSLRRAPNVGKLARATRIPAPGPISSSLTLTLSPCGICHLATPRENTTTFGAHRGVVLLLCYHAAAGFAIQAGPSSSVPPRRCVVPPIAVEGSISTHSRNGREGRRVLAVGLAFAITATASRRLSGSARGLDFNPPPERPRGTARPRRRLHHLRHRQCSAGRPSVRAPRAGPRFGRP